MEDGRGMGLTLACVAGAWKWWAQEKTGARKWWAQEKTGVREEDTRGERERLWSLTLGVSPSRAPVLSFAYNFQAPATQARLTLSGQIVRSD